MDSAAAFATNLVARRLSVAYDLEVEGGMTVGQGFQSPRPKSRIMLTNENTLTLNDSLVSASNVLEASAASTVSGMIIMWSGPLTEVPYGWALCDGLDGRPDMRGRFVWQDRPENMSATLGTGMGADTLFLPSWPPHTHTITDVGPTPSTSSATNFRHRHDVRTRETAEVAIPIGDTMSTRQHTFLPSTGNMLVRQDRMSEGTAHRHEAGTSNHTHAIQTVPSSQRPILAVPPFMTLAYIIRLPDAAVLPRFDANRCSLEFAPCRWDFFRRLPAEGPAPAIDVRHITPDNEPVEDVSQAAETVMVITERGTVILQVVESGSYEVCCVGAGGTGGGTERFGQTLEYRIFGGAGGAGGVAIETLALNAGDVVRIEVGRGGSDAYGGGTGIGGTGHGGDTKVYVNDELKVVAEGGRAGGWFTGSTSEYDMPHRYRGSSAITAASRGGGMPGGGAAMKVGPENGMDWRAVRGDGGANHNLSPALWFNGILFTTVAGDAFTNVMICGGFGQSPYGEMDGFEWNIGGKTYLIAPVAGIVDEDMKAIEDEGGTLRTMSRTISEHPDYLVDYYRVTTWDTKWNNAILVSPPATYKFKRRPPEVVRVGQGGETSARKFLTTEPHYSEGKNDSVERKPGKDGGVFIWFVHDRDVG